MNEFKFQIVNILLLGLLVFGMYWAFTHINNGVTYGSRDVLTEVPQTDTQEDDIIFEDETQEQDTELDVSYEVSQENPVLSENERILKQELEDLIEDNIYMKNGSSGTRVGTVQKFLNIYFDTTTTVDNGYGPTTMANVKKFQEAEGLGADGLAGPNTYRKMIEVLES